MKMAHVPHGFIQLANLLQPRRLKPKLGLLKAKLCCPGAFVLQFHLCFFSFSYACPWHHFALSQCTIFWFMMLEGLRFTQSSFADTPKCHILVCTLVFNDGFFLFFFLFLI